MGEVVGHRTGQHGDQADRIDGRGGDHAGAADEGGQNGQDNPADPGEHEPRYMNPEVRQALGPRGVMLDEIQFVGDADAIKNTAAW